MALLTKEEWTALTDEQKVEQAAEAPVEVQVAAATELGRKNATAEHERKSSASQKEIDKLNAQIGELTEKNKPASTSQEYREQYEKQLVDSPFHANSTLGRDVALYVLGQSRSAERIRRQTVRKLRKEVKDFDKYEDNLEEMLDGVQDLRSISEKSIRVMLDSLRGRSVEDRVKEAKEQGAREAREEAGIVGPADTPGKAGGKQKSDLSPEQLDEMDRMLLEEADYKEILRGRQEADKALGKAPRKLIGAKT